MLYSNHTYILLLQFGYRILIQQKDCLSYKKSIKTLILNLSLRILISLNSMIRLHLKTPFLYINPLNINFPNHVITGLDFPQIFIPITQGGQIWAVLMYLVTEINYMEEILFVLAQFSLGITFKIFIEIFYFIS